ncbi:ATP/GTP-binding domain protein [Mycobacterium xenopi 4042]|uniref:ATP/GTP-binding domain protein n=1 Tax=Mycobacterium xenopi 4042 TaxID=1299334 RepID=X7ZD60_MYCXE|nr:ATP/GTP-binding domain protein [Mycobacterium xenopi 4042]
MTTALVPRWPTSTRARPAGAGPSARRPLLGRGAGNAVGYKYSHDHPDGVCRATISTR